MKLSERMSEYAAKFTGDGQEPDLFGIWSSEVAALEAEVERLREDKRHLLLNAKYLAFGEYVDDGMDRDEAEQYLREAIVLAGGTHGQTDGD